MAQLITPPICIPASINFGSTTVASTYSNALSPWNGSSFTFNCTFSVLIQETSSYDTNPILQYNANNLSVGMWFGLPNGNCYRIQSITSVNAQGTSCVLVLKDVDLYNLVVDNTGNGNNFPPEGFVGLFFTIGSDGLPVITPTEQIRSQIGDITNWLNDLHDRFRFRNYITDYFTLNINDNSYTGIVEGNFVKINSSGSFVKVTGTTENDLLSIAGIVSSADTPEQGNLRVRPLGRVVSNLNILVGNIGDVLYFDPNQIGSLTSTKPATGVFPVYIKLSSTSAILKSGGVGASGTAGTAGSSGTAGTSGATGTAGTSGINGVSGGLIYWMNQSINTSSAFGTPTYKQLSTNPTITGQTSQDLTLGAGATGTFQTFATDSGVPGLTSIPAGNWAFIVHIQNINTTNGWDIYVELYTYTIGGTSTLVLTTNRVLILNNVDIQQVYVDGFWNGGAINSTDRLYAKIIGKNNGTGSKTATFYTEGSSFYSYAQTTFNAPSGTSGTSGVNGTSGTSGTNGTSGTSASSGTSGTNGTNGSSGSSGTTGTSGSSGSSGSSGTSATSGTSGSSGSSGSSGTSGISGSSGTSGNSGSSGTTGTSGTSGSSGITPSVSGASGQIAYFNGTSSITSDATFTYSPTSQLLVNNSVTAASAIARGTNLTPTLVAAANGDVLVGLDINPTFTNGAFTGVSNYGARIQKTALFNDTWANTQAIFGSSGQGGKIAFARGQDGFAGATIGFTNAGSSTNFAITNVSGGLLDITQNAGTSTSLSATNANGFVLIRATGASGYLQFQTAGTVNAQVFSTGNWLLQQGGTFTDAGYKLDVAGTTRLNGLQTFVGTTASDGGQLGAELLSSSGWTSTGWTGSYPSFTHTTGNTTNLTNTLAAVVGNNYAFTYTITTRTAGTITFSFGGLTFSGASSSGVAYGKATSTASLVITPTTDFDGTVVMSIKQVTAGSATTTFQNSSAIANIEVRASGASATNTFIGLNSGRYNVTGGTQNTSLGSGTLASILNAISNTAIGYNAGTLITTGGSNTLIGVNAGQTITTSSNNTLIGSNAGQANTTGSNNTAVGVSALFKNTTGGYNTAVGLLALYNNTTGQFNNAIGDSALSANTTGQQNNAQGHYTMYNNTTGSNNTALGNNALLANTTGSSNVVIGNVAANAATVVDNSIIIGAGAQPNASSQANQIVIGYNITGLGSNTTIIGNSSTTTAAIYGNLLLGTTTDSGYKLDVTGTGRFTGNTTVNGLAIAATPSANKLIAYGSTNIGLPQSSGSTFTTGIARLYDSTNVTIDFGTNGGVSPYPAWIQVRDVTNMATNYPLLLQPNGGNVGIGTSSPSTTLDVNGATKITGPGNTLTLAKSNNYPALAWQGSTYTNLIESGDGYMAFTQSGAERMRITSAGDVVVGGTSAVSSAAGRGNITINGSSSAFLGYSVAGSRVGYLFHDGGTFTLNNDVAGTIAFNNNGAERMRITSAGNVGIGTSSPAYTLEVAGTFKVGGSAYFTGSVYNYVGDSRFFAQGGGSNYLYSGTANITFVNQADTATLATINGTTGVYTPLSDINKKKDFEASTIGLNEILQLKPTLYRFKSEDEISIKQLGFIAQEVKDFIPQAYEESGQEDKRFIGLNYNPIVAALVKAVQELSAQVEELKNK